MAKSFGTKTGIKQPSGNNVDTAAIASQQLELVQTLTEEFSMAMASLFLGKKSLVKDEGMLKAALIKGSPMLDNLKEINENLTEKMVENKTKTGKFLIKFTEDVTKKLKTIVDIQEKAKEEWKDAVPVKIVENELLDKTDNEEEQNTSTLKLLFEGINEGTVDSLVKFSQINTQNALFDPKNAEKFTGALNLLITGKFATNLNTIISELAKMELLDDKHLDQLKTTLSAINIFVKISKIDGKKIDELISAIDNLNNAHIASKLNVIVAEIRSVKGISEKNINNINLINTVLNKIIDMFANKSIDEKIIDNLFENIKKVHEVFTYINTNFSKDASLAKVSAEKLKESFSYFEEVFDTVIKLEKKATLAEKANKTISESLQKTEEQAINSSKNTTNINLGQGAIVELGKFVAICGLVMLAGAAIIKIPGMVQNSIKFGLTLGAFILSVLAPIALLSKFGNADVLKEVKNLKSFVAVCALIMLAGAAVMMIPGLVKTSLMFGATLGLFIAAVLTPITLFSRYSRQAFKGLNEVTRLVAVSAMIMLAGAAILMLGGGQIVKTSLQFGVVLAVFIGLVLTPILMFTMFSKQAFTSLRDVTHLIAVSSAIMLAGAVFIMLGGGKLLKAAFAFGFALAVFIGLVLLPILAFTVFSKAVKVSLRDVTMLIAVSAMIMMAGAAFILLGGGQFVVAALTFGLVLALFIGLVLAPILAFSIFTKLVQKNMRDIVLLILVSAVIMTVGALFLLIGGGKFAAAAVAFGLLLAIFIGLVLAPYVFASKLMGPAKISAGELAIIIAVSAAAMLAGAWFIAEYGAGPVIVFAVTLGLFIAGIMLAYSFSSKLLADKVIAAGELAILVGISAAALVAGAYAMKEFGWENVLGFTVILGAFVYAMITIYAKSAKSMPIIKTGRLAFVELTAGIAVLSGAIMIMAAAQKIAGGALQLAADAYILYTFVTNIIKIFEESALAKKIIKEGRSAFIDICLGLTILSGVITIIAIAQRIAGGPVKLAASTLVFTGFVYCLIEIFKNASKAITQINKGSEAFKEMAIGIGILTGSIAAVALAQKLAGGPAMLAIAALILDGFAWCLIKIFNYAADATKNINKGSAAFKEMAIGIGILTGSIAAVALAQKLAGGPAELALAALILDGFVLGLIKIFNYAADATKNINKGSAAFKEMATGIAIISGAITAISVAMLIAGGPAELAMAALILDGFIFGLIKIFNMAADAIKNISKGSRAFDEMAVGIAIISGAITLMALAGKIAGGWEKLAADAAILATFIGTMILMFSFASTMMANITTGATAFVILSAGVAAISGAILIMALAGKIAGSFEKLAADAVVLGLFVAGMIALFTTITFALPVIAMSTGAVLMLTVSILALSGSILAMAVAMKNYKESAPYDIDAIKDTLFKFLSITDIMDKIDYSKTIDNLNKVDILAKKIQKIVGRVTDMMADYANLSVPVKWNDNGDVIKRRLLTKDDFTNAAEGVKSILLTITKAISDTIEQNKWILSSDFRKILYRVGELTEAEGEILSILCESLQSYARLQIPTKWNKEGKPIKFRLMTQDDFTNAAKGIEQVMTTLAAAISNTYKTYPSLFGPFGWLIIEQVQHLAQAEGEILGTLSDGLTHYAKLMIADKWNNKGIATHYRQMTNDDFVNAGQNIGAVMVSMAGAISAAWNGTDYKFTVNGKEQTIKGAGNGGLRAMNTGSWFGGMGVADIIQAMTPMGDLVSSLAEGLSHYAALQIPDKWNSKGKPVHFKNITDKDFLSSVLNIGTIITTVAQAIARAWNGNGFNMNLLGMKISVGNTEGLSALIDSDEFSQIMDGFVKIGDLIGNISDGLASYAKLQIPTRWNSKGKPVQFRTFEPNDFIAAADNIADILITTCAAVKFAWSGGSFTLHNGTTWTSTHGLKDYFDADEFSEIMDGFSKVGELISSVATGIGDYSKLQIATKWNAQGKPIQYRNLTPQDFTQAATNITKVLLTTIFGDVNDISSISKDTAKGGLLGAWLKLKDLNIEDEMADMMDVFEPIGEFIGSMSETVANFANLIMPTRWEDGKAVSFRQMRPEDMKKAATGIQEVLGVMVGALTTFYKNNDDNIFDNGEDSVFAQILKSFTGMGELIKNISEGVNAYASGQIPIAWDKDGKPIDFQQIGQSEYTAAGKNISAVLKLIGETLVKFSTDYPNYFETDKDGCAFKTIMEACSNMGNLIKDIADGITVYAKGGIPVYGKDGKIIRYDKWPDDYFETAAKNIGKVITCVGEAVVSLYKSEDFKKQFIIGGNDFEEAITAVSHIGECVKNISDGVQAFANLKIPTAWGKDGKPTSFKKMTQKDFEEAQKNIQILICNMGTAVIKAYTGEGLDQSAGLKSIKSVIESNCLEDIEEATKTITSIVSNAGKALMAIAELKIPQGFDKEGKATGYTKLTTENITQAGENVKDILIQLPTAINAAQNTINYANLDYNDIIIGFDYISQVITKASIAIKTINKYAKDYSDIFGSKSYYTGITPETLSIGMFKDLYGIMIELGVVAQEITKFAKNPNNLLDVKYGVDIELTVDVIKSTIQSISKFAKEIIKQTKNLQTLTNKSTIDLITNSVNTVANIGKALKDNVETFSFFAQGTSSDNSELVEKYTDPLYLITDIVSAYLSIVKQIAADYNAAKSDLQGIINSNISNDVAEGIIKLDNIAGVFNDSTNVSNIFNTSLNSEEFNKALNIIDSNSEILFSTISSIYNAFTEAKTSIEEFAKTKAFDKEELITKIVKDIDNFIAYINDETDLITNVSIFDTVGAFFNKFKDFISNESTGFVVAISVIKNATDNLTSIITEPENEKEDGYITSRLKPIINDIKTAATVLNSLSIVLNTSNPAMIINATGQALNVLANGIIAVNKAMQSMQNYTGFGESIKQLNTFINESINKIDLERIDKLISLTNALNTLAEKTTNLDALTNAIANELTDVLEELVTRMDEAKNVIQLAEQIQDKRHKKIDESIKQVSTIMAKEIVVKVTKDESGGATSTSNTGANNNANGSTSSATPAAADQGGGGNASSNGATTNTPVTNSKSTPTGTKTSGTNSGAASGSNTQTGTTNEISDIQSRIEQLNRRVKNLEQK